MSLSDRLASTNPGTRAKPKCITGSWLLTLPQEERDAFAAWVEAGHNRLTLLEECQAEGLNVTASSFYRHTNGKCHCARQEAAAVVAPVGESAAARKTTKRTTKAKR